MSKRKKYDPKLIKIGQFIEKQRKIIYPEFQTREKFIDVVSQEIFGGEQWISVRHLSNIELGKNLPSFELMIKLSVALDLETIDFFAKLIEIYLSDQ